jgi:hypothetical protein
VTSGRLTYFNDVSPGAGVLPEHQLRPGSFRLDITLGPA